MGSRLVAGFIVGLLLLSQNCSQAETASPNKVIRVATYNVAMYRDAAGLLAKEIKAGYSGQASQIAEVIRRVRPDIILINEIDYEEGSTEIVDSFRKHYLETKQENIDGWPEPIEYPYYFYKPVNTGVDSGEDFDQDGSLRGPADAYGFGRYPGQYGMLLLSRYPILEEQSHTFQKLLWKDYPKAMTPRFPDSGEAYYSQRQMEKFRLSSKSFWDVCVQLPGDERVHLLCSHPTPAAFDGPEDRNGCRNYDEIGMVATYVSGGDAISYLKNDSGESVEGIGANKHCVVLGDLNADPVDGSSKKGAIQQLLDHPLLQGDYVPKSTGGRPASHASAKLNSEQKGDPSHDTSDFSGDNYGNLRIDYVIPSKGFTIVDGGIFWPLGNEPSADAVKGSDHRLVWLDLQISE